MLTVNTTMGGLHPRQSRAPGVLRLARDAVTRSLKRVSERHAGQWIEVSDHRNIVVGQRSR